MSDRERAGPEPPEASRAATGRARARAVSSLRIASVASSRSAIVAFFLSCG